MPIPIELLKKVSVVYVHGHCPDGLASAMILRHAFSMLGTKPRIEFLVHGTPEHRAAGLSSLDEMPLFCDIAPHAEAVRVNGIVLDHHVGARAIVEAFGDCGVYADAEKEPGVSGAVLAFREVWEPINRETGTYDFLGLYVSAVQEFAEEIGARDTWQTRHPLFMRGQWASKTIMSKPASHWLESRSARREVILDPFLHEDELRIGRALFEAHEEAVRQAVEQCVFFVVPIEFGGQKRLVERPIGLIVFQEQASGFRLCSDVAEAWRAKNAIEGLPPNLGGNYQVVVAGFSYVVDKPGEDPRLLYSLRGLNGFDVCRFAKENGGGGHKAAAGFSVPYGEVATVAGDSPYNYIKRRLLEHLERIHGPQLDR